MNYQEALQYIYGFADLERGVGFSDRSPARYRFQRIGHLLHEIGDPHQRLRIAHIAGSNGKGSTSAMLAAIAGPDWVMEGLEWGKVLHFGSHNAPRLGLHATKCMLEEMLKDDRAGFRQLTAMGEKMAGELRGVLRHSNKHPAVVQGVGSMFQIFFTEAEAIGDYRDFCHHVDRVKFRDFVRLLHK